MKLSPFGKLVRRHRLEQEVTLNDMASRVGVSAAFASAVETGTKKIPAGYPQKVSAALRLDEDELADLEEAAEISADEVKIPLSRTSSRNDREVVALFARRFHDLPEDRKITLRQLLEETEN